MEPTGSPFRRPPPRPAVRARSGGFGPVPAARVIRSARRAPPALARIAGGRGSRARARRQGAGAFFLVAALTLVGAALSLTSHDPGVIIGLGLIRWMGEPSATGWTSLALVAGFALLGLLAHHGRLWAFVVGATVYALDGLIVLAAHDWMAVAIHTMVLVLIVRGLDAGRRPS
jgi:hypothetical protein